MTEKVLPKDFLASMDDCDLEGHPYSIMLVVGCGGIAYHSAMWLRLLASRMVKARGLYQILVDPDTITNENAARQWPDCGGLKKINALRAHIFSGCVGVGLEKRWTEELGDQLLEELIPKEMSTKRRIQQVNVFAFPDNDKAREDVERWCVEASQTLNVDVVGVTAGCSHNSAVAYPLRIWKGRDEYVGWTKAIKARPKAPPVEASCGELPPEQTPLSNAMASALAYYMYDEASKLEPDAPVADYSWSVGSHSLYRKGIAWTRCS